MNKVSPHYILTALILIPFSNSSALNTLRGDALGEKRLSVYRNFIVSQSLSRGKCRNLNLSSNDSPILAFKKFSYTSAFIIHADKIALISVKDGKVEVQGISTFNHNLNYPDNFNALFHGAFKTICGSFTVPYGMFAEPLVYYSITPRMGEVIVGKMFKGGQMKFYKSSTYEYGGNELKFDVLSDEK